MNELGPKQQEKAIRILKWLACSFRPLKIHEIKDGIAFHAKNTILNADTQLPASVINLCKPIIEETPGNTVDFVHYSAKE
jgi:hypothetical protein